jgi:nucleotide-binding universal stress UspA family protein
MSVFGQVLCPIDFSDTALRALEQAAALANRLGARLTMLHVAPTFARLNPLADPDGRPLAGSSRDNVIAEMRRSLEQAGGAADGVTFLADEGDVAGTILARAEEIDADLIVMGTHGRTGLSHLVLGSVAEQVIRGASCPVLTVRP